MQLQAHFKNIQSIIIEYLQAAETEILAAVAWFTDAEIFEILCNKRQAGLHVSIALLGDDINKAPYALDFQRLSDLGGRVTFLPAGSDGEPMMHHKFCVLDGITVITGSYNWSKKAQSNDENITIVIDAADFAAQYRQAFYELAANAEHENVGLAVQENSKAIRRRLEMVRNLILLNEQEDLPPHIQKLKALNKILRLQPILQALERGAYKIALEEIEAYLKRNTSLVAHEDIDVTKLQFQLKLLELRLQSLSDEKSELERRLVVFNSRYNDALGSLLVDLLKAAAELAQCKAKQSQQRATHDKEAEQEFEQDKQQAEQAEKDWYEYKQEYQLQQEQEAPNHLSDEQETELKALYRKSCSLCHPDKLEEEQKDIAHQVFVELQEVYKKNDLAALRDIYTKLKTQGLFKAHRSSTLSRTDTLRAAIAELQHRIADALKQIQQLYNSEASGLLRMAGNSESEWNNFFAKQKELLVNELHRMQQEITIFSVSDSK